MKNNRRSISVRGETKARLQVYCKANGIKPADLIDKLTPDIPPIERNETQP